MNRSYDKGIKKFGFLKGCVFHNSNDVFCRFNNNLISLGQPEDLVSMHLQRWYNRSCINCKNEWSLDL